LLLGGIVIFVVLKPRATMPAEVSIRFVGTEKRSAGTNLTWEVALVTLSNRVSHPLHFNFLRMRANTKDGWVDYDGGDELTFFTLQPAEHRVMEVPLSLFYKSPIPERAPHYQVVVAYGGKFQALEVSTNGGPGVQKALSRFKP